MSELKQLAQLAQQFTGAAFHAFDSKESADAGNALLAAHKAEIDAAVAEVTPFQDAIEAQVAIIEANSPADPFALLIQALQSGKNPEELQLPEENDDPEAAAAKDALVAAAEAEIAKIEAAAAPASLKLNELFASLLKQALPAATFENIVPDDFRSQDVSDGFTANNDPTLASAFAPH